MRRRLLESIGVATAIIGVTVLLNMTVAPVPLAGQAPSAPGQTEAAPAGPTAWGEPDLQGIWTTNYEIPLQRPPRLGLPVESSSPTRSEPSSIGSEPASSGPTSGGRSGGVSRTSAAPTARRSFCPTSIWADGRR